MPDAVQRFLGMHLQDVATVGVEPEDDRCAVDGQDRRSRRPTRTVYLRMCCFVDLAGLDARSAAASAVDGRSGHVVTGVNLPMLPASHS